MRYFLLFIFIITAVWLAISAFQNSSDIVINYQWNGNPLSAELTSTTLIMVGILSILALYLSFTILKFIFGFRKRLKRRRSAKLSLTAKNELTKGLVLFTEGRWEESESLLMNNVKHSETPLLCIPSIT